MAFKSAITVASIALIATASSLAMAAPSEARTPVVEPNAAMTAPSWAKATYHSAESMEEAYEAASRHEPNIVRCFEYDGLNPSIQPVVNPRIGGSDYRRVLINRRIQIGSRLHPYPQTPPNPYTQVIYNHNNPTVQTVNPYPQTIVQPSISIPYTPFAYQISALFLKKKQPHRKADFFY